MDMYVYIYIYMSWGTPIDVVDTMPKTIPKSKTNWFYKHGETSRKKHGVDSFLVYIPYQVLIPIWGTVTESCRCQTYCP